jgi:hypothetical protein
VYFRRLFDNGVFPSCLIFSSSFNEVESSLFRGAGQAVVVVFLIGVRRYPSPSLFGSVSLFFRQSLLFEHNQNRKIEKKNPPPLCIDFGKSNFKKQNETKEGRQLENERLSVPPAQKKRENLGLFCRPFRRRSQYPKLHLYIRRPIRHAWLTLG